MLVRCLAMMRGGGETRHLAWIRELTAMGVDVDVYTGRPLLVGGVRYPVHDLQATVIRSPYARDLAYRVGRRRGFGRLSALALHGDEEWFCRACWRRIAASRPRPDIVHAHALHQTARLRRVAIPVVINLPGPPHARYTSDLRLADALVADGWAARHLPAALGRSVEEVPKGVDTVLFRPEGTNRRAALGLQDRQVVVAVSRLVPIKNVGLLVDAMAHVRRDRPDAHLLVVGEGPERAALEQRARDAGVKAAVTFAGYVPHHELAACYRAADVFALPSEFDNSPNALLEAMACGLPVVATDVGGVRDFVDRRKGSELVPPGDASALAAAIVRALAHPEGARDAGAHNRRFVLEHFSWRTSARKLLDVYEQVLATGAPRARATA
jgi:glycosyltransferase involved in cell wall biosynthesis